MPLFKFQPRGKPGDRSIPAKDYNELQRGLETTQTFRGHEGVRGFRSSAAEVLQVDPATVVLWAKATSNWEKNSGDPKVACVRKGDKAGTSDDGMAIDVFLLPNPTDGMDPNIVEDDIVGYILDGFGRAICVTDYLDDRIGCAKFFVFTPDSNHIIPTGWGEMNGTANSVANGGSGIDMRGKHATHPGLSAPDPIAFVCTEYNWGSVFADQIGGELRGHGLLFIERLDNSSS